MRKSLHVVLVILSLLLVSCGPAATPGVSPQAQSGEVFLVALPRIVIDIDEAGDISVLGIKVADIGRFTGRDLSSVKVDKAIVDRMVAGKLQHVEIRQMGDRLAPFVNGKPLPHIAWTDEALQQTADVLALLNVPNANVLKSVLPIVRRLGLDVVVRFPRGAAAEIPMVDLANPPAPAAPAAAQAPSVLARFEIKYDARGVPAILGITAEQLAALGISLPVALDPSMIQKLQTQNIQNMEINGKASGLTVYVNGNPLPSLVWDQQTLTNAVDLYSQMDPSSPYGELIKMAVPVISNPDVAVLVHFPAAAGQAAVPAKMH